VFVFKKGPPDGRPRCYYATAAWVNVLEPWNENENVALSSNPASLLNSVKYPDPEYAISVDVVEPNLMYTKERFDTNVNKSSGVALPLLLYTTKPSPDNVHDFCPSNTSIQPAESLVDVSRVAIDTANDADVIFPMISYVTSSDDT
jgi:hypothetical protein